MTAPIFLLQERSNTDEILEALKDGKRTVEAKLQAVLGQQKDLSLRADKAACLEETLRYTHEG